MDRSQRSSLRQPFASALKHVGSWLEQLSFAALAATAIAFAVDPLQPLAEVGFFAIRTTTALGLLAVSLWLLARVARAIQLKFSPYSGDRDNLHPPLPVPIGVPVVVWLMVLVASTALAPGHNADALNVFLHLLLGVLVGWAALDLARDQFRWQLLIKVLALAGLTVALGGVGEAAKLRPWVTWLEGFRNKPIYFGDVLRISSTQSHPNVTAMALELTLPLVSAWALTTARRWLSSVLAVGLLSGVAVLLLTLSRGGTFGFFMSFLVTGVMAWRGRERRWAYSSFATLGTVVIASVLLLILNPPLIVRLISEGSNDLWYRAVYQAPATIDAQPGEILRIPLTLTNRGLSIWQSGGSQPFQLSYHLVSQTSDSPNGRMVAFTGQFTPLPINVPPSATVGVSAQVLAPPAPGSYTIEWDLIQQGVTWFSSKGQPPGHTQLYVIGTPVFGARLPTVGTSGGTPKISPTRLEIWQAAWELALLHPLLGVGPGNFQWYALDGRVYHAHSIYLDWLAETGSIGLLSFLWLTWELARTAWLARGVVEIVDDPSRIWWLALIASLLAWFTHGGVDFFYGSTTYIAFSLVAGLLLGFESLGASAHAPTTLDAPN